MTSSEIPNSPEPAAVSDRDLVNRLQAGQVDALGLLYDRYATRVYTLALKMMKTAEEAEDLTQEVFLSLWQRQNYDPDRGHLGSYLTTYTRSRALDRLRVRSNRHRILQSWHQTLVTTAPFHPTPEDWATQQERLQRLQAALAQLPESEREVLWIAYFEGQSQTQIAQRLDLPLGTVKSRSRKGLIRLRDLLQSHDL